MAGAYPGALRTVAFWGTALALLPVLLPQALFAALRTPRLPEAAGPRDGRAGPEDAPVVSRVLVIGESTAVGVGVERLEQALAAQLAARLAGTAGAVTWQVIGCNGARVRDMRGLLGTGGDVEVDLAIVLLGVNDTVKLSAARRWRRDVEALAGALRAGGARQVAIPAVPPVGWFTALPRPLRWVLGWRAALLDAVLALPSPHYQYVALQFPPLPELLAADGYHPSADGYRLWAGMVLAALNAAPAPGPVPAASARPDPAGDTRPGRSAASAPD